MSEDAISEVDPLTQQVWFSAIWVTPPAEALDSMEQKQATLALFNFLTHKIHKHNKIFSSNY